MVSVDFIIGFNSYAVANLADNDVFDWRGASDETTDLLEDRPHHRQVKFVGKEVCV